LTIYSAGSWGIGEFAEGKTVLDRSVRKANQWPKSRVTYVYERFLPRKVLSMVAGTLDEGKSLFAAWVAAQITTGQGIQADGTLVAGRPPGKVWYNTMEDAPDVVVRWRLQAAGADLGRVFLTDWHLEIPNDAAQIRDVVRLHQPDLVILDSMQQHFKNLYHGFRENRRGMDLLFRIAKDANISILFIHHFNKGKHPSVEGAIGGQGIIQNMTKAIFVIGQHKSTLGTKTRYLACERINAAKPPTLSFELHTRAIPGSSEPVPYFTYTGIADVSSMDVFDASKTEERRSGKLTSADQARDWLVEYFKSAEGQPRKVREVEATAQRDGRWFSKGTFERARDMASVQPVGAAELRRILGDEFDWLSDEDRPPKARWMRLQLPKSGQGKTAPDH
jgi:hypothetical protein